MSTDAKVAATRSARDTTSAMALERKTSSACDPAVACTVRAACLDSMLFRTSSKTCCTSRFRNGFVRKCKAPWRRADTASSTRP